MIVPNQFPPEQPGINRLAIVGECPGSDETNWRTCPQRHGFAGMRREGGEWVEVKFCPHCGTKDHKAAPTPFVGPSGFLLNFVLREAGMDRRRVFVGNCAQTTVAGHDLEDRYHKALAWGCQQLQEDLAQFAPHCVLLLGGTALRCFHPRGWEKVGDADEEEETADESQPVLLEVAAVKRPSKRKAKPKFAHTITDWRGSIFGSEFLSALGGNRPTLKCVSAYHPAAVLRQPEWNALLRFDVTRAVTESATTLLDLPERTFYIPTT